MSERKAKVHCDERENSFYQPGALSARALFASERIRNMSERKAKVHCDERENSFYQPGALSARALFASERIRL
jgi:hypothetical protein